MIKNLIPDLSVISIIIFKPVIKDRKIILRMQYGMYRTIK
jgi:hypothetical protein